MNSINEEIIQSFDYYYSKIDAKLKFQNQGIGWVGLFHTKCPVQHFTRQESKRSNKNQTKVEDLQLNYPNP